MHSAKPAGTASAGTVDSFARDSHILHRPGMPIKTRGAHQDQGCPSRPGVPVKTRGAHQDQGCPSRPGVPIKTRGAHQDQVCPSRPGVPIKTRGAHQDQGCPSRQCSEDASTGELLPIPAWREHDSRLTTPLHFFLAKLQDLWVSS